MLQRFLESAHLFGIMNVDLPLDITRLVIAAALLIVAFAASVAATRAVIGIVGAMYVVMALVAFADETLFDILPTGFTGFDIGFHLVVGILALVVAFIPGRTAARVQDDSDRAHTPGRQPGRRV
ncbi:DUF4383 domain-containing protein [Nesterenkonia flava]|uniref:DUF4383 domain-containing protein n=1 Tax=Nesterenkonia flava TaxID=469799 RepID=A0ABU1FTQ8_9MICC|nr:DUF4383 domain-containing protein [Nesterenkonia flava]MDR5712024.1 DUF4383 domain-containing protein [Nesterenkonia flava]